MNIVTCPKCGMQNPANAVNCVKCKINLQFALEHPEEIERIKRRELGLPETPTTITAGVETGKAEEAQPDMLSVAIGAGAIAGIVGGLATHFFSSGVLTGGIALVVSFLFFGGLSGWARWVAFIVFAVVAGAVVGILRGLSR